MKTYKISLLLIAFLFGSLLVFGQPQKQENGKRKIMEHLELTESQQTEIEKMHQSHQDQMLQVRSEIKIKEAELDVAMLSEDNKLAKSLANQINELRSTVFSNRIEHQLAVKALLDEDQKRKFDQMILAKDHMDRPGRMHGAHEHERHMRHRGSRSSQSGN